MSEIRRFLQSVDEDYLIGLTNKGIVKRSHKDLETEEVTLEEQDEEIRGSIGDIKVILKLPLTDSICSCPSSSMCKHVIMTILAVQKGVPGEAAGQPEVLPPGGTGNQGVREAGEHPGQEPSAEREHIARREQSNALGKNTDQEPGAGQEKNIGREQGAEQEQSAVQEQNTGRRDGVCRGISTAEHLQKISAGEIKKAVGAREWAAVLELVRSRKPVKLEEGSLVTVQGDDNITVKLAHPLLYSTCSICHNDKFCRHKAWAALSFLMEKGILHPEELEQEGEEGTSDWDGADMAEVLRDILAFLKELLLVGCSRSSPETPYGLERLAIRCHGAGLAALEGKLRALSEQVKGYQERRAGMTARSILQGLSDCHSLAVETRRAIEEEKGSWRLLGSFRTQYRDIPEKILLGVGMRQFVSGTGYQGHTIYFLEEATGIFYTFTLAMPTIYESKTRRMPTGNEVPWGLPCTLTQLSRARILLKQGKANDERRLSSTSQAHAELLATGAVLEGSTLSFLFDDFEQLWNEYKRRLTKQSEAAQEGMATEKLSETDRLFLIRPKAILDMHYEEAAQRLVFWLEDFRGRRLRAQLTYSRQEEAAIRSLERLVKKVAQGSAEVPIFIGSLYVEDGECTLYPIETLE